MRTSQFIGIGAMQAIGRILGFVRDATIISLFGINHTTDAVFLILRLPNTFRSVVGDGAVNPVVVPFIKSIHERRPEETATTISQLRNMFMIISAGSFLFCCLYAGALHPELLQSWSVATTFLTYFALSFLVVFLIPDVAITSAAMIAKEKPEIPVILNIISSAIMAAAIPVLYLTEISIWTAGLIFLLIIATQTVILKRLNPSLYTTKGAQLFDILTAPRKSIGRLGKSSLTVILGGGIFQMNFLISLYCAGNIVGGLTIFSFFERIVAVPIMLASSVISTALLPSFVKFATRAPEGKDKSIHDRLNWFVYLIVSSAFFIPAFAITQLDNINLLLKHFLHDASQIATSAIILSFMAVIPLTICSRPLANAMFALGDYAIGVRAASLAVLTNLALNGIGFLGGWHSLEIATLSYLGSQFVFVATYIITAAKIKVVRPILLWELQGALAAIGAAAIALIASLALRWAASESTLPATLTLWIDFLGSGTIAALSIPAIWQVLTFSRDPNSDRRF